MEGEAYITQSEYPTDGGRQYLVPIITVMTSGAVCQESCLGCYTLYLMYLSTLGRRYYDYLLFTDKEAEI